VAPVCGGEVGDLIDARVEGNATRLVWLSDAERKIQLPRLSVTQTKTILAVERLRKGVLGLDNDRVHSERA
jgi:hypothetical protein